LRKQIRELHSKVHLSEQGQDSAQKENLTLGTQVKAGPIGTEKRLRMNPTVLSVLLDESVNPTVLSVLIDEIAID